MMQLIETIPNVYLCVQIVGTNIERVDVSEPTSISSGIAARYATAIFELAKDESGIATLENNVVELTSALEISPELNDLISSPVYSREEQRAAISAVAAKMKLMPTLANALALMADKRRLFVLPALTGQLRALIAEEKGEVTAEVISAKAMTKTQIDKLAKAIKERIGKDVNIDASVDEEIIGGLVVKVGSKMIDTSIRSKLNSLQNVMKEVG